MTTAETVSLTPLPTEIRVLDDIDGAFAAMASQNADAALVLSSRLTFPNRPRSAQRDADGPWGAGSRMTRSGLKHAGCSGHPYRRGQS